MTELQELTARLERAEEQLARASRRARLSGACALAALSLTALLNLRPAVLAQSPGASLASLVSSLNALTGRVSTLEAKTAPMTTTAITTTGTDGSTHQGYLVTFTGANVQIVNGTGATTGLTSDPYDDFDFNFVGNGLGNLIIGYNEARAGDRNPINSTPDARTGSHNLILGNDNNYTGIGGLVAGQFNAATASFASVSGGLGNTATKFAASVSGGDYNTASGHWSSVSGGDGNTASGAGASVSGGSGNTESSDLGWSAGGSFHNP